MVGTTWGVPVLLNRPLNGRCFEDPRDVAAALEHRGERLLVGVGQRHVVLPGPRTGSLSLSSRTVIERSGSRTGRSARCGAGSATSNPATTTPASPIAFSASIT